MYVNEQDFTNPILDMAWRALNHSNYSFIFIIYN